MRNEEVLLRVNEQKNILHEIRKWKANCILFCDIFFSLKSNILYTVIIKIIFPVFFFFYLQITRAGSICWDAIYKIWHHNCIQIDFQEEDWLPLHPDFGVQRNKCHMSYQNTLLSSFIKTLLQHLVLHLASWLTLLNAVLEMLQLCHHDRKHPPKVIRPLQEQ